MTVISLTEHWENGTLEAYLSTLPDKMKDAAMRVLDRNADHIVNLAQQIVRVDTGTLRGSIRKHRVSDTQITVTAGGAQFINPKSGRPCNYAAAVEAKYPFFRPAVDMIKPMIASELEMEVLSQIE